MTEKPKPREPIPEGPTVLSPTEIRFERLLPGPIKTVGAFLTNEKKRGEWLAPGPMDLRVGGTVELRFKHSDLSPTKAAPPKGYEEMDAKGHQAKETITELDAPGTSPLPSTAHQPAGARKWSSILRRKATRCCSR